MSIRDFCDENKKRNIYNFIDILPYENFFCSCKTKSASCEPMMAFFLLPNFLETDGLYKNISNDD